MSITPLRWHFWWGFFPANSVRDSSRGGFCAANRSWVASSTGKAAGSYPARSQFKSGATHNQINDWGASSTGRGRAFTPANGVRGSGAPRMSAGSSTGRAEASGASGCGFDPRPAHHGPVAKPVKAGVFEAPTAGSSPARSASREWCNWQTRRIQTPVPAGSNPASRTDHCVGGATGRHTAFRPQASAMRVRLSPHAPSRSGATGRRTGSRARAFGC